MIIQHSMGNGQHFELLRGIERNELSPTMHQIGKSLGKTTFELGLISFGDREATLIHSESIYHEGMCPYFMLGCVEQADEGGGTKIYDAVEAATIIDEEHPELRETTMVYHAEHYDATKAVVPLIRNLDGEDALAFRQDFYLNEIAHLPEGWNERDFYDYIDRVLERCVEFDQRMEPGDLLIVNNYKTLHVRLASRGWRKVIRVRVDDPAYIDIFADSN